MLPEPQIIEDPDKLPPGIKKLVIYPDGEKRATYIDGKVIVSKPAAFYAGFGHLRSTSGGNRSSSE